MSRATDLIQTYEEMGTVEQDVAVQNISEEFNHYGQNVMHNLSMLVSILEGGKLKGVQPYTQLLRDLSAKSDEILKKVSDFVDKNQAKSQQEEPAKKDKEDEQSATVA